MADLHRELKPKSKYYDKHNYGSKAEYEKALEVSSTVYVGNLSFFSSEDSIVELFSMCGQIQAVKMGISDNGTPCGFCFVIFKDHQSAHRAVEYLSGTKLLQRVIRVDWDPGYKQGREKGRGSGGIQKRDEFRNYDDSDRPVKKPNQGPNNGHYNRNSRDDKFRGNRNYSKPRRYDDGDRDNRDYRDNRDNRDNRDRYNDRRQY